MEALLKTESAAKDPWLPIIEGWTGTKEYPWQKQIINELAVGALAALEEGIKREKLFG